MDRAALERLVEDRLRAVSDAQNGATPPVNTRGTEVEVEDEALPTNVGRYSSSREARVPKVTRKQAEQIMRFFQNYTAGDVQGARQVLVSMGQRATTLQQVGVSADGGTTLPSPFVTEVLIDLPNSTPFADSNLVRIVPMTNETLRWTKVTARPALPANVKEGAAYSKSGVSFAPITLVAKKIGEIIPFTEEILMSEAIGMVSVISSLVADAFAFKYNTLVTNGNGDADEPEGVLTNADVASVAWDGASSSSKYDSLISLQHAVKSQYRRLGAIWLINDTDVAALRKIKDGQGRPMWVDGFGPQAPTLFGRPVIENPDQAAGTILFGNFVRGYVIGKREGMTIDVNSSGEDWEKDIKNYKFRERWDGRVTDHRAFAKMTGVS
jgi:HK97 family phage major capsid protein